MPHVKNRLCKAILTEHFGPIVQKVGMALLERGRQSLSMLVRRGDLPARQVRESLFVLLQHSIVTHAETAEGPRMVVYYQADPTAILLRDRFPLYLKAVRERCGPQEERLMSRVLQHGRVNYKFIADQKREPGVMPEEVAESFQNLLDAHILTLCAVDDSVSVEDRMMSEEAAEMARRGGLPLTATEMTKLRRTLALKREMYEEEVQVGSKRKVVNDVDELEEANKRQATGEPDSMSPDKYYRPNYAKLHVLIRNAAIANLAEQRVNSAAGEIVRKLLVTAEPKMRQCKGEIRSEAVSQLMLSSLIDSKVRMPVDGRGNSGSLIEYLETLTEDEMKLVTKESEAGGGQYAVALETAGLEIKARLMESIVQEKFGDTARRIWRIMHLMTKLNETQVREQPGNLCVLPFLKEHCLTMFASFFFPKIAKFALVPLKVARHCLYILMNSGLAFIQDVPKTMDHSAARTFFLWYVSIPKSTTHFTQNGYKASANLKQRRFAEMARLPKLLEKLARSDITDEHLTESELHNKAQLEKTVTRLLISECRIAEMLIALEEF
ncbi:DNA-directed RNA polymerase III subunit RPC3 [Thoreauomyces humboldtii]|nr:DNA-directed RNA polymerase III subunit RPC3 [Thoreauomyces humboldtii]